MRRYCHNYLKLNEPFKRNGEQIYFDVATEMLFSWQDEPKE